jgi:hypothetical protein
MTLSWAFRLRRRAGQPVIRWASELTAYAAVRREGDVLDRAGIA